ncbi:MAG: DUF2865 domain-containing protein [Hyphomicrobiaceae bacterium]|nr:DUF2865 domain-containing protein [Hyphomicrobiaceae bacterium]
MLAFRELIPMAGLARYAVMLAVLGGAASAGGAWLMGQLAETVDHSVQVTVDEDLEPVSAPRLSGALAAPPTQSDGADTVPFEHARAAPRLFERVSDSEAERIKASVRDNVVADGPEDWYHGNGHTFHTVCVRLCDGAYFPISYSTTRDRFATDEAVCKSRCAAAPARLFVWPNPGGAPETMRDRRGGSYVALPTAFQFRRGKTQGCSCRPEAWEEASISRHAQYARDEATPTGSVKLAAGSAARVAGWHSDRSATEVPAGMQHNHGRPAVVARADAALADSASATEHVSGSTTTPVRQSMSPSSPPAVFSAQAKPLGAAVGDRVTSDLAVRGGRDNALTPPVPVPNPQGLRQGATLASKGVRKRRPAAPIDAVAISTLASAANASLTSAELPAAAVAPKPRKNWGIGPNAASAPRGHTAYDVFARNFY